ncbi:type II toxin-antitoxin system RelE/ParE family toxin [Candidatus Spongiihabitans sp.]|uniref:type II toxin-antitoxin system RelE/ParE family toxin n=1 Tax=Candidatus Spongiihabitans sp. TaxID=3101308 RepID=UPI003C7C9ADE
MNDVSKFVDNLPAGLRAKYFRLASAMKEHGPNLGLPHTRAMSGGLFELRINVAGNAGRVFYCTLSGRRIIMLRGFIKKSRKTPTREINIAKRRLAEVKK